MGDNMALVYLVTCDPATANDVVERRLTIKVNGETKNQLTFDPYISDLGEQVFLDGDNVVLSLVDVDDVGNVSEPAVLEFVAADTIPPERPGFNVKLVREE